MYFVNDLARLHLETEARSVNGERLLLQRIGLADPTADLSVRPVDLHNHHVSCLQRSGQASAVAAGAFDGRWPAPPVTEPICVR